MLYIPKEEVKKNKWFICGFFFYLYKEEEEKNYILGSNDHFHIKYISQEKSFSINKWITFAYTHT